MAGTAPTVSVALDKPSYKKGDKITATVNYSDPDSQPVTITVTVQDSQGNTVTKATTGAILDPLTLTVSDDGGRVWAKVSDSGAVAVFTATA